MEDRTWNMNIKKRNAVGFLDCRCLLRRIVSQKKINIKKGLLRTEEDDTLMYKIQDVKLVRSLWERIFKLGTVICYSGDVTDAKLMLAHIKNSSEIKEYILETAEEERRKVRTLHTMGLDGADDLFQDVDD